MVWGATCVGTSGLCEEAHKSFHDISTTGGYKFSRTAASHAGRFAHRWSTKCERHANAGYEAALARLAQVELDPRVPLDDEAGPRLRVAHYAQILAYFGMKPPVPEPPPVDI